MAIAYLGKWGKMGKDGLFSKAAMARMVNIALAATARLGCIEFPPKLVLNVMVQATRLYLIAMYLQCTRDPPITTTLSR